MTRQVLIDIKLLFAGAGIGALIGAAIPSSDTLESLVILFVAIAAGLHFGVPPRPDFPHRERES